MPGKRKKRKKADPAAENVQSKKIKSRVTLRRTAKETKKYSVLVKGIAALSVALVAITAITYAISYFYDKYGSFTVKVDKYDMMNQGLSLSETPEFTIPISRLNADAVKGMTNISGADLPNDIDGHDGNHSGSSYIAYTFYLKNSGKDTVAYNSKLLVTGVTQNIDAAIRVRLYKNGEPVTYAKPKENGEPEYQTSPFESATEVVTEQKRDFKPGDVDKFTVVIWLEGDDPDCVDAIIGGQCKLEMDFEIAESS